MSAPKSTDAAAIPRIVLDSRDDDDDDPDPRNPPPPIPTTTTTTATSSSTTSAATSNGPGTEVVVVVVEQDMSRQRCHSDAGVAAASLPNLTLAMTLGEGGAAGDKLGVYCSPRAARRSADLDTAAGTLPRSSGSGSGSGSGRVHPPPLPAAPLPGPEYDWLEDSRTTSSLQVLGAGNRVGSALSLTSVCTAHSVGLLSNDSSDDLQDSSLYDGSAGYSSGGMAGVGGSPLPLVPQPYGERPGSGSGSGPLRRLQSYPEEDKGASDAALTPRTSHSLCNLKAVQVPGVTDAPGQGQVAGQGRAQLTPEKLGLLPSECEDRVLPPGLEESGGSREGRVGGGGVRQRGGGSRRDVDSRRSPMVSYGSRGSNALREGRIRRWLEDMDKASQ